ncbi:MAG: bile acid:sodium symporter [Woeseiaceae bacterium]|nr:bile acid:sodium symporter [Woeseiaceae bacterium]
MLEFVTDSLLPAALFTMMLGVGASTSFRDYVELAATPRPLLVGVLSLVAISPALGLAVASLLPMPAELAIGLVLLASCPGGLFSNYMTALGKGAVPLSIGLTATVSLIYVFTAPAWAGLAIDWFGDADVSVQVPYSRILVPLLLFLLIPVLLGMTSRSRWPGTTAKWEKFVRELGGMTAIACFCLIVYSQKDVLVENASLSLVPVVVFNLTLVGIGILVAWTLKLDAKAGLAYLVEHTIRQEGTGIYIAASVIGSLTATWPMLINTVVGMTVSMILVLLARTILR